MDELNRAIHTRPRQLFDTDAENRAKMWKGNTYLYNVIYTKIINQKVDKVTLLVYDADCWKRDCSGIV